MKTVFSGRQAALVRLWIETTSKTQYVETVSVTDISAEVWPVPPRPEVDHRIATCT